MHDRKLFRLPELLQRFQRRVQPEITVEIYRAVRRSRFLNGDIRSQIVIFTIAMRHHHIQSIDRSALKYRDQNLLFAVAFMHCLGIRELLQKIRNRRHQPETRQTYTARFQKISSVHNYLGKYKTAITATY